MLYLFGRNPDTLIFHLQQQHSMIFFTNFSPCLDDNPFILRGILNSVGQQVMQYLIQLVKVQISKFFFCPNASFQCDILL